MDSLLSSLSPAFTVFQQNNSLPDGGGNVALGRNDDTVTKGKTGQDQSGLKTRPSQGETNWDLQQTVPSGQSRLQDAGTLKHALVCAMGLWKSPLTSVFCLLQSWGILLGLGISKGITLAPSKLKIRGKKKKTPLFILVVESFIPRLFLDCTVVKNKTQTPNAVAYAKPPSPN